MIEVLRTRYAVKQTTDNLLVETTRGEYDEASIEVDKPPRATFVVPDPSGVVGASVLREGKEFVILRGVNGVSGERRFTGIIETVDLDDGDNGGHVTVRGVHKGYRMLQQHLCDTYDYDEDGNAGTTRDGVTINPYKFFILRKPGGAVDARGDVLPIDGVNFADAMRHLIGTRFIHQIDFQDNRYLRASQIYSPTNKVQVWRDGESGDLRAALQRNRSSGAGFVAGGSVETVPLENGSPLIDAMGNISSATITLIGVLSGAQNPTVEVCPNARETAKSSDYDVVARYKLDETNGASAADAGPNGLTGTITGAATWEAGKFSNALRLASGQYVTVPDHASLNPTAALTVAVWLKADAKDGVSHIAVQKESQYTLRIVSGSDQYVAEVWTGGGALYQASFSASDWTPGAWHHLAMTYDGANLKIYLDGVLKHTTAATGTLDTTANPLTLGKSTFGWDGALDDAVICSRALTAAEILKLRDLSAHGRVWTLPSTVSSTNVLQDDGSTDTGLDKWTYTFPTMPETGTRNSLGIRVTLPGSEGDAATTKIYYMKIDAVTASDTGLSEGTIATYNNPVALRDDIDPSDWVDTDLSEKNRLTAIETLRKLTESASTNPSPHWDAWIDDSLQFHFVERRGADITNHDYSFREGNLRKVSQQHNGNEIAYQTIAYGAGSGEAQMRIVTNEEFSAGGLYDADRDPKTPGALYGQLARVMSFVDENERSPVSLFRKARAFHKLHRQPVESLEVEVASEFIRHFGVGDSIQIKNLRSRTSGLKRVVELRRVWDGSAMERLRLRLGNPARDIGSTIANQAGRHDTLVVRPQPAQATTGLSGSGVNFTKDHYGFYSFGIPEGAIVERVILRMTTLPWQVTSKGGAAKVLSESTLVGGGGGTTTATQNATSLSTNTWITIATFTSLGPTTFALLQAQIQLNFIGTLTFKLGIWDGIERFVSGEFFAEWAQTTINGTPINSYTMPEAAVLYPHDANGKTLRLQIYTSNTGITGKTFLSRIGLMTHTAQSHSHDAAGHTHTPLMGIWQFDGDEGDGTGVPVYASGVRFAVDPTVDSAGIPTSFATEQHPTTFGKAAGSQTVEFDVTGFLAVDANGFVKSGEHRVYFLGALATANSKGLGVVSVTPVLRFRQ